MRTPLTRAPDGTDWKVQLVWRPRRQALARRYGGWRDQRGRRSRDFDGIDVPVDAALHGPSGGDPDGGGFGDDLLIGLLVLVALVVAGALVWWLLLPLLLVVIDGLLLLVLVLGGAAARGLLGRPWVVEAVPRRGPRIEVAVRGLSRARRTRALVRERIAAGLPPWDEAAALP